MKCEACQHEVDGGDSYIVRYGSERTEYLSYKQFAVHRSIAGTHQVFICDACLNRFINRRALLSGLVMAVPLAGLGLVNLLSGKPLAEQVSPLVLGVVLGALLFLLISSKRKPGKSRQQMGDLYAIQLLKPVLKQQGYRYFYTRQD